MTVRSQTQQDEIEPGDFRSGDSELLAQHRFISVGNGLGIGEFAGYAMNLRHGKGQVAQERVMGHSIITVRMIRWDVTFIAPKKPDFRPIELAPERWGDQSRIETFRSRASGQGQGKRIPCRNGLTRMVKEVLCRGVQQRLVSRVDVYVPLRMRHARSQEGEPMAMRQQPEKAEFSSFPPLSKSKRIWHSAGAIVENEKDDLPVRRK